MADWFRSKTCAVTLKAVTAPHRRREVEAADGFIIIPGIPKTKPLFQECSTKKMHPRKLKLAKDIDPFPGAYGWQGTDHGDESRGAPWP